VIYRELILLQMSFASQSTAVFTAKAVRCRCNISRSGFCRRNFLVSGSALQVGFL